jgi:hypothetical protein
MKTQICILGLLTSLLGKETSFSMGNDMGMPRQTVQDEIRSFIVDADLVIIPDTIQVVEQPKIRTYSDSVIGRISEQTKKRKSKLIALLSQTVTHVYEIKIQTKSEYPEVGLNHFELGFHWIEGNKYSGDKIVRDPSSIEHISDAAAVSMQGGYGFNHPRWKYIWTANPKCKEAIRSYAKCKVGKDCHESKAIAMHCQSLKIGEGK